MKHSLSYLWPCFKTPCWELGTVDAQLPQTAVGSSAISQDGWAETGPGGMFCLSENGYV